MKKSEDTNNKSDDLMGPDWMFADVRPKKKPVGVFSLAHALDLERTEGIHRAMQYAAPYTSENVNEGNRMAKDFIIGVVQNADGTYTDDEVNEAWKLFHDFFNHYVLSIVDRYYTSMTSLSEDQLRERKEEAIQTIWLSIIKRINGYDPTKAQITTYFRDTILFGEINAAEAKNRPNVGSRRNLEVDRRVENLRRSLREELGREPTAMEIVRADRDSEYSVPLRVAQVQISLERVDQNNNMKSLNYTDSSSDDDNDGEFGDKLESQAFPSPETTVIKNEATKDLYQALNRLSDVERSVLLFMNHLELIDGHLEVMEEIVQAGSFARRLGIHPDDMKLIYTNAVDKMMNAPELIDRKNRKKHTFTPPFLTFNDAEDIDWTEGFDEMVETFELTDPNGDDSGDE